MIDCRSEPPPGLLVDTGTTTDIVAFLFTDIEGSTRWWEREPTQMQGALSEHDRIARAVVLGNGGVIVKMVGDGVHAAFGDPLSALLAAVALQRGLADPMTTGGLALRVRCGIHAGAVQRRDGDFFGSTVNRAQRIMSAGNGGQILLSRAAAALVEDRLPGGMTLRDLGAVRLRDTARAEQVFQLVHPELQEQFPALRGLEATPSNIPQQVTLFVGRERELAELHQLLPRTRLLTLLGTGGIGKTRLALQVASELTGQFRDGVWFVDFSALDDPGLVAHALAHAWGLTEVPGTPLMETICQHARTQQTLLILDNCEHVLAECVRLVDRLLHAGPELRIIVTSREALRAAGEQTYTLPPLLLPDRHADLETLCRSDAVRLFADRARLRQPDFVVTAEHAAAVWTICARLDGIPLALELAAARVGAFSVERIAARLGDRFALLARGDRTAMPRQQTLKALIDWSYDLLDAVEKILLARLSVFAGGWTLDAAESVCVFTTLSSTEVVDGLDRLVQKSLVTLHASEDRYRYLESIHDYAANRLLELGETEALRELHHAYFLDIAEAATPAWRSRSDEARWLNALEAEYGNLNAALAWCLEHPDRAANALRMCGSLGHFWRVRGHWREGREWCNAALKFAGDRAPESFRAKALITAAMMNARLGETAVAEGFVEAALALARNTGDQLLEAGALNNLSNIVADRGDFERAHALLEGAVAINRKLGNHAWEAINLGNIGELLIKQREFDAAQRPLEQALARSREIGNRSLEANALANMAMLAERRGDHDAARTLGIEALAIYRNQVAPAQEAEQLLLLARAYVASGEAANAALYLGEALGISRELGYRANIGRCFEALAGLAVLVGAFGEAAFFQGAAHHLREVTGVRAPPSEHEYAARDAARGRAAMGESAFAAESSRGRESSLETAAHTALEWLAGVARGARPPDRPVPASTRANDGHGLGTM